ncbi:biotin--[acetyl-CoA-carboxylase] ligase [Pleurocapsales cyanobacterium LEGE 06147]|nr:biotin--[acetyl-CoA-carboxylase] ligase [Pleurocapsales cyanobacterium LEGE 06147]
MRFDLTTYQTTLQNLPDYQKLLLQVPLYAFDSIPSTNQRLWQLIDEGKQLPIAVLALQQTAGRGQWGRVWHSPVGGLYLSLAIAPHLSLNNHFHLTMATAWGIANILRTYRLPVLLKWPNDLILEGRKLGGIKIETRTQQQQITHAVIGVGINWANPVPDVGINLQSFYEQITEPAIASLEELAGIVVYGILAGYQHYLTLGIEQLLADYQKFLFNLGQKVTIEGCKGVVTGVTINGQLRVSLQSPGATTEICLLPGQIHLGYDNFS